VSVIDANGRERDHVFGEGDYAHTEQAIRQLLAEAHHHAVNGNDAMPALPAAGVMAAATGRTDISPETYVGSDRAEHFASPEPLENGHVARYTTPSRPSLNQWGLDGSWKVSDEAATLQHAGGAIVYRFRGRDLHLVLGNPHAKPVRFTVTLDGAAPGSNHGSDVAPDGDGTLSGNRLYQLLHLQDGVQEHTFRIVFHDAGAQAFAFTFG
jgi:hypothetical protein